MLSTNALMFFMMEGAMQPLLFDIAGGGHANQFIGDGLLADVGAPERYPGHDHAGERVGV